MSRVLVTGAGGFIGTPTTAALIRRGAEVHAISRRPRPSNDGVVWHRGNLLAASEVRAIVDRLAPTHLLHLAWDVSPGYWSSGANVRWLEASLELLGDFAAAGGRRAVLAGTCAEYDWARSGRREELGSAVAPQTLYGVCKNALREVSEAWAPELGVQIAWGRIFFPYGPGEPASRLIPSIARAVLHGREAACSSGAQIRDFIHVQDVGEAFARLVDADLTGPVNIASGIGVSVADVARMVGAAAGDAGLVRLGGLPDRQGEPTELTADVRRLREELGLVPRFTLSAGLADAVRWWQSEPAPTPPFGPSP